MADTAVGLFEDALVADAVVDALRAHGFPSKGIQVLGKPESLPVDSATSTPAVDFAARLIRDLRSMGVTESESEAYVAGVHRGNVLVLASGSREQADAATNIMNQFTALNVEEFAVAAPALAGVQVGEVGAHDISSKEDRQRAKTVGARIFSW
jgi:hypothetical protein